MKKLSKLEDDTVMEYFMKISGDDASEFIEDFFEHFDIYVEEFNYRRRIQLSGACFS
ncbi:hypothetical protein [Albibacterium profundi]|uniref:hypothetical protein n=1 Tax=Albibacterium profundi TaxID=3134906 RepID=UPI0035CFC878